MLLGHIPQGLFYTTLPTLLHQLHCGVASQKSREFLEHLFRRFTNSTFFLKQSWWSCTYLANKVRSEAGKNKARRSEKGPQLVPDGFHGLLHSSTSWVNGWDPGSYFFFTISIMTVVYFSSFDTLLDIKIKLAQLSPYQKQNAAWIHYQIHNSNKLVHLDKMLLAYSKDVLLQILLEAFTTQQVHSCNLQGPCITHIRGVYKSSQFISNEHVLFVLPSVYFSPFSGWLAPMHSCVSSWYSASGKSETKRKIASISTIYGGIYMLRLYQ